MLKEYVTTLPVAVGAVSWQPALDRLTIIVKMRLVANEHAVLVPVAENDVEALSLDVFDERGTLTYASDFAPYKTSCDFYVAGPGALDRAAEGRISAGPVEKNALPKEGLGPRETFCAQGDPTEPSAFRAWSSGKIDFSRFQAAPPDQRIPFPRGPFAVRYARGASQLFGRFLGREPRVRLLAGADAPETVVAVSLDTIAMRPDEQGATLLFRGLASPRTWSELVVVDAGESFDVTRARRFRLVDPSMARVDEPAAEDPATNRSPLYRQTEMTAAASVARGPALPFRSGPSSAPPSSRSDAPRSQSAGMPPSVRETLAVAADPPGPASDPFADSTSPHVRPNAAAMPFARVERGAPGEKAATPAPAVLTPREFSDLRGAAARVPEAFEARGETMLVRARAWERDSPLARPSAPPVSTDAASPAPAWPPSAPANLPPRAPLGAPPAPLAAASDRLGIGGALKSPVESAGGATFGRAPEAPPKAPDLEAKLAQIQKEVWRGERSLAEILSSHSMTELEWRAAKKDVAAKRRG